MDFPFDQSAKAVKDNIEEFKKLRSDGQLSVHQRNVKVVNKLKECSDGPWTLIQESLIEVEVNLRTQVLLDQLDKLPTLPKMVEMAKELISDKFKDDPEMAEFFNNSFSDINNIRKWMKKANWKEEVEKRMKDETLFSAENRYKMIHSVMNQGLKGSAKHAEMWLKMSGDLNKSNAEDPMQNTFKGIQAALGKRRD